MTEGTHGREVVGGPCGPGESFFSGALFFGGGVIIGKKKKEEKADGEFAEHDLNEFKERTKCTLSQRVQFVKEDMEDTALSLEYLAN